MAEAAPPVVFLDTCVLYPPLLRAILVGAARAGLFTPRFSPRVLAEWRVTAGRKQGAAAGDEAALLARDLERAFPDAAVEPAADGPALPALPDPADAHVLAAAVAAGADTLLTFNLRDFPRRTLAPLGLVPRHPDGFLWELWSAGPETMERVLAEALGGLGPHDAEARKALRRAGLWRLARALG